MNSVYERICSYSRIARARAASLRRELYSKEPIKPVETSAAFSGQTEVKITSYAKRFFHCTALKVKTACSLLGRVALLAVLYVPLLNIIASRAWELLDPQSAFLAQYRNWRSFSGKTVTYADFSKSFWSLETIPDGVLFPEVESLDFQSCDLTGLPSWIGKAFPNLLSLNLSHNKIGIIPESMKELTQLRFLRLRFCALTSLPPRFGESFFKLEELDLSLNPLRSLPESMKELTQLRILQLAFCALTSLPPWFGKGFSNLEELDLTINRIRSPPESMRNLTQLRILQLRSCNLTSLPPWFGEEFRRLEILHLDGNQIATIPRGFSSLRNTRITAYDNRITDREITRIRQENLIHESVTFDYSIYDEDLSRDETFNTLASCIEDLQQKAKKESIPLEIKNLEKIEGFSENFLRFYKKLFISKLYTGSSQINTKTAETLLDMLLFASTNPDFLVQFSSLLGESLASCGDRVSYYFDLSYMLYQCYKIQDKRWTLELQNLFVGFARFHLLFKEAQKIIENRTLVDPLEIHLALLVKLKERLNLPIFSEEMLYFSLTDLTQEDLQVIERKVTEQTKDIAKTLALNEEFENHFLNRFYSEEERQSVSSKQYHSLILDTLWGICAEDASFPKTIPELNSAQHKRVLDGAMLKYNLQKVALIQGVLDSSSEEQ